MVDIDETLLRFKIGLRRAGFKHGDDIGTIGLEDTDKVLLLDDGPEGLSVGIILGYFQKKVITLNFKSFNDYGEIEFRRLNV